MRLKIGLAAALVAVLAMGGLPSRAATAANCDIQGTASVSPGIGLSPSSGSFSVSAATGLITCTGAIGNVAVGGLPVPFSAEGTYSGTCGSVTASAAFPAPGQSININKIGVGTLAVTGTLEVTTFGVVVVGSGNINGKPMLGGVGFAPTPSGGNCVTPITQVVFAANLVAASPS